MGWSDGSSSTNTDWFGVMSDLSGDSSLPYSQYSNNGNWFLTDDASWDSSFDESFGAFNTGTSYLSNIWNMVNTPVGTQAIGGAISAGMTAYNNNKQEKNLNTWKEREYELAKQKMELEGGLLALKEMELMDKIETRAKHNASINTAPKAAPKVRFR